MAAIVATSAVTVLSHFIQTPLPFSLINLGLILLRCGVLNISSEKTQGGSKFTVSSTFQDLDFDVPIFKNLR